MKITNTIIKNFNKVKFKAIKNSPELLMIAGGVGIGLTIVSACKATLKAKEIVDEHNEKIADIHEKEESDETKKEVTQQYAKTTGKLIKTYAPSVVLGVASYTLIFTSNRILKKRNTALAAAYMSIDTAFDKYRSRVKELFGEDVDRELRYGIKKQEVEETVVDEKGKSKTVKKCVDVFDELEYSDYAKIFDSMSKEYTGNPEYDISFLKAQEAYFNNLLHTRGYVFLNEVYKALDIPDTKAGQIVGWIDDEALGADNYISFGIFDVRKEANRRFINGIEDCIILDFNVDGPIIDDFHKVRVI